MAWKIHYDRNHVAFHKVGNSYFPKKYSDATAQKGNFLPISINTKSKDSIFKNFRHKARFVLSCSRRKFFISHQEVLKDYLTVFVLQMQISASVGVHLFSVSTYHFDRT